MTDEQIKQNAEEYADSTKEIRGELEWCATHDDFIAGAHSRDEEIEELKEEIESLQGQYKTCFDGFKKRGRKLGELMKENVKLRNPWISVEDRLPEIDDYVVVIMPTEPPKAPFVKISYLSTIDNDYFFCIDGEMLPVEVFTQWMPIPEPPKGGAQ